MRSFKLACIILAFVASATCPVTAQDTEDDLTCGAGCNCRFNNVQTLDRYIQSKVARAVANANFTQGVTFIRWGKRTCPSTEGTELLYAGRAGGTFYNIQGGGAEILCLPENPDYLNRTSRISTTLGGIPRMFGTEYEFFGSSPLANLANHNVPCARCYVPTRATMIMIPAKTQCPPNWTREYYGYLTTEHESHYRSSYNCVDISSENYGSAGNENGAVIYYVASTCHGFPCPPYENDRALSCVVCTK